MVYPSPDQGAGQNAPNPHSYVGSVPYPMQGPGQNPPPAYENAQAYNTPAQAGLAAHQMPPTERRWLIVDLLMYPWQSVRSLCLPGMRTFARESMSARWGVVWITLFALPLLSSMIALLLGSAGHRITSGMLGGMLLAPLITIPILFFIVQGMIWPLARHYQGGGTFLEQCYTTFLPLAPLFLVGSVAIILESIDATSRVGAILVLLELLLFIYSGILLVVSLKAIHGVTTWEAIALAILPLFSILAVIALALLVIFLLNSSNDNNSSSNSSNSSSSNKNNNQNNNTGNTSNTYQQNRYRGGYWWWWWGGPYYGNSNRYQRQQYANRRVQYAVGSPTNPNPRLKIQWFCAACQYLRWMRQGPVEVACVRCGAPMQPTEATR